MSKESSPLARNTEISAPSHKGRLRRWIDSNAISIPAIAIGLATWPSLGGAFLLGVGGLMEVKGAKDFILPPEKKGAKKVAAPLSAPRRVASAF